MDENWRSSEWKTEDTVEKLERRLVAGNNLEAWRSAWRSWASSRGRVREQLDPAMRREARTLFDCFDRDGSGLLDMDELGLVFRIIGVRIGRPMLRRLLTMVGRTHYDLLDFDSFVKYRGRHRIVSPSQ